MPEPFCAAALAVALPGRARRRIVRRPQPRRGLRHLPRHQRPARRPTRSCSLAGLPRDHIAAQMRAFRDGQRPATVMHQIAKGYTDAQIDALAACFAAQKHRRWP